MRLLNLPFESAENVQGANLREAVGHISKIIPTLRSMSPARGDSFQYKIATCLIGDLRLAATALSGCRMEIEESSGSHLVVPCSSQIAMRLESAVVATVVGKSATLVSNLRRVVEREPGSVVIVGFDPGRLVRTCAAIAGPDAAAPAGLDEIHLLDFAGRPQHFGVFLQICATIDAARKQDGLAERLGLDDTLYRWMATGLMCPEALLERDRAGQAAARLDIVCDTIRAARERPLTLTEMESLAGLSSRSLQYAFMARFGCSPMEWQRRERMDRARQSLLEHEPGQTITAIAYAMGFSSSAAFATQYKRYFGETPSETLRHALPEF